MGKAKRRSGRKIAADKVSDEEILASLPKDHKVDLSSIEPSERARLESVVRSRRPTSKGRREITLARSKTELDTVAHPTLTGNQDSAKTQQVERVVDTLTTMYNRGDISQIQYSAGDRYRSSYEMTSAGAGGAMNFDRVRGGGTGDGFAQTYMNAAEDVRQARLTILYPRDYAVLHRVCVEGKTFERVAGEISAMNMGVKFDRKEVGFMFKSALNQLAAAWWPKDAPKIDVESQDALPVEGKIRSDVSEKSVPSDAAAVEPAARVAHAVRDKIYWTEKDRRREERNDKDRRG